MTFKTQVPSFERTPETFETQVPSFERAPCDVRNLDSQFSSVPPAIFATQIPSFERALGDIRTHNGGATFPSSSGSTSSGAG